jgi:hypothetical protein
VQVWHEQDDFHHRQHPPVLLAQGLPVPLLVAKLNQ